jgi:uncharacterized membrane protein
MKSRWFQPLPEIRKLLKKNIFAGLLIVIPLSVIAWIVSVALRNLWKVHQLLPIELQPQSFISDPTLVWLLNLGFTLGLTLLVALGLSLLGWVSKQYLGQKILVVISEIIQRIPVIRSVYSALDQLLRTLAASGDQQFSRVVYLEYPRKGIWTLAFVTGPNRSTAIPPGHLNVYVPTTPNPTSGFYLIVPEAEVRDAHLPVEDAFKTLLSLGIAQGGSAGASPGSPHVGR